MKPNWTACPRMILLAAAVAAAFPAAGAMAEATYVWGFDDDASVARPQNGTVAIASDPVPAVGKGCLAVTPERGKQMLIVLDVPAQVNPAEQASLACRLRLADGVRNAKLRWFAVDGRNRVILQRRVLPDETGAWAEFILPLADWRWGNEYIGDWSEVRKLALRVESATGTFHLDDLRFEGGTRGAASAVPDADWYLSMAFGKRERRIAREGDVLVATDAVGKLTKDDLAAVCARLGRIRKWVKRVFGDACRPMLPGQPVVLLIFADEAGYRRFFESLGERWLATIAPPGAGGYTVQDISASTYSAEYGADRPVWFHEGVHCAVTRELRLLTGVAEHSWLHEGLANYLQLCVYPQSMPRRDYVRNFRAGVGRRTFFRPLKDLLTRRATASRYAQLASVVAFLVEKHPKWLRSLAAGLADRENVGDLLKACGTDFDELQAEWLTWGREHFAEDVAKGKEPRRHFALPPEFATVEAGEPE